MAGDDTGSNVGSKGKLAAQPVATTTVPHPSDKLKIAFPDTFNGDRKKLKSFLIQVELWMAFNSKHFTQEVEQILWAVALLRGPASDWISNIHCRRIAPQLLPFCGQSCPLQFCSCKSTASWSLLVSSQLSALPSAASTVASTLFTLLEEFTPGPSIRILFPDRFAFFSPVVNQVNPAY
jgi:hypothetical protein